MNVADEDPLYRIDDTRRCSACHNGEHYYATYVGPDYAEARIKILFIALDAGADSESYDLLKRRDGILRWYQTHWNQHYRGCIWVASYLLGSLCLPQCSSRCSSRCEPEHGRKCVLRLIAQGNAVKCVPASATGMYFNNRPRIPHCLPLMFEEIPILRPDVILLQGRNDLHGPFFKNVEERGGKRETTKCDHVSVVTWPNDAGRSVVVSLNHPSRGNLQRDWEPNNVPALDEARQRLHASPRERITVSTNYPWGGRARTLY